MPSKLTSWSFSRYADYQRCPLRFKLKYLEKHPLGQTAVKSPALERGAQIHDRAAAYLRGEAPRLDPDLKNFAPHFKAMRAYRKKHPVRVVVEDTWAIRTDWTHTVWNDWNGCWLRIKLDLGYLKDEEGRPAAFVDDYKTGRFRPDDQQEYGEQLDLYALGALNFWQALIPEGLTVTPRLLYTDVGTSYPVAPRTYQGSELPALRKAWEKRVKPMFADKKFVAKPNSKCRFCEFSSQAGGPCKY